MKKEYKDLMINAGWKPVGKADGRRQRFTQDLGDRTLTAFAMISRTFHGLDFDHGAVVSFNFFSEAFWTVIGSKKISLPWLMNARNDCPLHFEQEGDQEFIQEQTSRIIAWAKSIDPVAEVMVGADRNRTQIRPILDLNHECVSLALLGDVEELELYLDDFDSERFEFTYESTKREMLVKALELAKSGELSWAPWQRPRLEEWKGKDLSHIDHVLEKHWSQVKFGAGVMVELKVREKAST